MNRTLTNVLFGGIGTQVQSDYKIEGTITKTSVDETAEALANADSVILVSDGKFSALRPSNSVFRLWVTEWLLPKLNMLFRISFVCSGRKMSMYDSQFTLSPAGKSPSALIVVFVLTSYARRMPGQCNVLLAEAAVPYDSTCTKFLIHTMLNFL